MFLFKNIKKDNIRPVLNSTFDDGLKWVEIIRGEYFSAFSRYMYFTDNIWLFHVDDIGQNKRELIFPNDSVTTATLKHMTPWRALSKPENLMETVEDTRLLSRSEVMLTACLAITVSCKLLGPSITMPVNKRKI